MYVPLNGNRSFKTLGSSLTTSRDEKISKSVPTLALNLADSWSVPNNKRQAGWFFRLSNCHHRATGRRNNLRLDRLIWKFFV